MKNSNKKKLAAGITVAIAIAAIAGYYYGNKKKISVQPQNKSEKAKK